MKEGVYWVTLFITIYVSLFFSECANSLPKKDGFEQTQLREDIKELTGNEASSKPSASNKLKLARTCFWLGYLQNTIVILDPENRDEFIEDINNLRDTVKEKHLLTEDELEDWEKNSPKERAQASLYLGYSYLSLGYESEAYKNFIKAFEFYPDLELDKKVLEKDEYLEGMIKNAEIFAQMEREFPPLVLFVAVDGSQSISKKQVDQIEKLQRKVKTRLKSDGEVLFYRFGNSPNRSTTLTSLSSSDSIIESLRTDIWTDFRALFEELDQIIKEYSENSTKYEKAVLIISDGEHSVPDDLGGREARIPPNVTKAIKTFTEAHPNVPIVIITTDRMLKTGAIQSGFSYAAKWTKELEEHSAGKSLYYGPGSKPEEILTQVFDIIGPYRDEVFITLDRNDKKRYSFNEKDECTVELVVRCTLPNVDLKVTGHPDWKTDSDIDISSLFPCKWEQTDEDTISITDSTCQHENLIIGCSNIEKASLVSREPRKFTLTFMNQDGAEIRKISLFFKQKLRAIEITKGFKKKVIMKSNAENPLKFQSKIDLPNHLKEPILLSVGVLDTNCFYKDKQKKIISIDTTGSPGRHEFDLLIKTKRVGKLWSRISDDNIPISFETNDRGTTYHVDTNQVRKIDFRLVSKPFYCLYYLNYYSIKVFLGIFILFFLIVPVFVRFHDGGDNQFFCIRQWWIFVWLEASNNPNSGVEKATLYRESSGKNKRVKGKKFKLSKKKYISPVGTYRIILENNQEFNVKAKNWVKRLKQFLPWCFYPTIGLAPLSFYVSWPWDISIWTLLLVIVGTAIVTWYFVRLRSSMEANFIKVLSGITGLLDIIWDIIQFFL